MLPFFALALLLLPLSSWAGNWVFTFSGSTTEPIYPAGATGWNAVGSYTFKDSVVTGPSPWGNAHPNLTISGGQMQATTNQAGTTTLSVTATLTWTPSYPEDASQPPSTVDVLETASTEVHTGTVTTPGTADDGLDDTPTISADNTSSISKGSHLTHLTVPAGQMTVSLPSRSVTGSFSAGGAYKTAIPSVSCIYSVAIDTREVTISCPTVDIDINGGSQYRDPALTGPVTVNVRQADGTLRGDSAAPVGDGSYSYTANVAGAWAALGTTYHWYGSISGTSASGDYAPVQSFLDTSLPGAAGQTEHIFLSMYDGGSGNAEAKANYYMHFHKRYEPAAWPPDGAAYTVPPTPDPEVPNWPTYPWELPNPAIPLHYNDLAGDDITIAPAGFKDVDGGLDLGKEPVSLNFGFTYQLEDETTATKHLIPTPPVSPGYVTWPVYRPLVNRTKGHLDQYGTHGYIVARNVWRKDEKVGWDIRLYDQQPEGTAVTAPPPNWNP